MWICCRQSIICQSSQSSHSPEKVSFMSGRIQFETRSSDSAFSPSYVKGASLSSYQISWTNVKVLSPAILPLSRKPFCARVFKVLLIPYSNNVLCCLWHYIMQTVPECLCYLCFDCSSSTASAVVFDVRLLLLFVAGSSGSFSFRPLWCCCCSFSSFFISSSVVLDVRECK